MITYLNINLGLNVNLITNLTSSWLLWFHTQSTWTKPIQVSLPTQVWVHTNVQGKCRFIMLSLYIKVSLNSTHQVVIHRSQCQAPGLTFVATWTLTLTTLFSMSVKPTWVRSNDIGLTQLMRLLFHHIMTHHQYIIMSSIYHHVINISSCHPHVINILTRPWLPRPNLTSPNSLT